MAEDPEGILTEESALHSELFKPYRDASENLGFRSAPVWIRFVLENKSGQHQSFFLRAAQPIVQNVRFVMAFPDGTRVRYEAGAAFPFSERPVKNPSIVFPMQVPPGISTIVLIRVQSTLATDLPFVLLTPEAFYEETFNRQLLQGLYLGIAGFAILYNLFLFFSTRDRPILLYVIFVLNTALFLQCHTGYAFQFLWPDHPSWNRIAPMLIGASGVLWTCMFTADFLNLRVLSPGLNTVLLIFGVFTFAVGIVHAVFPLPIRGPINILGLGAVALVLFSGLRAVQRRNRSGIFFLLSFVFFAFGATLFMLRARGLVPAGLLTNAALQIGAAVEIIVLSLALGDRINSLREEQERLRQENMQHAQARKEVVAELALARRIQLSLLPARMPQIERVTIAARYEPMATIGGDFYDFYRISDTVLGIMLADVSGHGIPAALVASMVKVAGAEQIALAGNPSFFLTGVNRALTLEGQFHFVTASMATLDLQRDMLMYANAGHPPLIYLTKDQPPRRVRPQGRILGVFPDPGLDVEIKSIYPGDRLVFYTDGVIEAAAPGGEEFGLERLEEQVVACRSQSGEEFCNTLLKIIRSWESTASRADDLSIVVVDIS
ncbi:MAG: SpoIIE family protein phosphatase [Leptospirales bacterium]|nr:SpoIIE family protein phosphatase [Leptospirales bacterium]